ncbi:uncharacterized protein LOC6643687 [Drosophila willistoni]|uniref:uncharacterized protein LOC6643687 n=1 Tax=Drosophila willistoni TaxID=7260 RepID=UPI00017D7B54|nr:uncharacterized protein LOC6643687 [Drosophila willistoni]
MSTFSYCCFGNMLPMVMLLMLLCVLMLMPEAKAAAATTTTTTTTAGAAAATMRGLRQRPKTNNETSGGSSSNNNSMKNNNAKVGSKYEIRGVAGEPNYKSVNLTWEVEFVPLAEAGTWAGTETETAAHHDTLRQDAVDDDDVTNMSIDTKSNINSLTNLLPPKPKAFQIYYCEIQNYGPQRCRVKLVNASAAEIKEEDQDLLINEESNHIQHFSTAVDNLRMATKYSFHIRPAMSSKRLQTPRSQNGRSEFNEENEIESLNSKHLPGQSIIIPTKGFSAHATQCLPHASEIEVETGPYFAGRIVVDGGNCGVKGDANDPADKYTMRIDHKKCGSMVKPETNTVETFITVQENLGIFTHSTRRFVVVCSYQSGMQTVRASFMVPGKNGVAAAYEPNDPFQPDGEDERFGREMRHMRYVNKSELVLKEPEESVEQAALVVEELAPSLSSTTTTTTNELPRGQQQGRALTLTSLNELNNLAETEMETERGLQVGTKYAKLVVDQSEPGLGLSYNTWTNPSDHDEDSQDAFAATLRYISSNLGSVLVTVSISVIIISICLILLQRRQHRLSSKLSGNRIYCSSANSPCPSASGTGASHLPHKTLPRALQHQQYQCTL